MAAGVVLPSVVTSVRIEHSRLTWRMRSSGFDVLIDAVMISVPSGSLFGGMTFSYLPDATALFAGCALLLAPATNGNVTSAKTESPNTILVAWPSLRAVNVTPFCPAFLLGSHFLQG